MTAPGQLSKLSDIDLTDLDMFVHGDPHAAWKLFREQAPIYWHPKGQGGVEFWSITKYWLIREVMSQPTIFSSEDGINLPRERADERTIRREEAREYGGGGQSFIMQDPPAHAIHRNMINRRFTPRAVAPSEPHFREIATAILDEVIDKGECDFVTEVAARLPTAVICEMMGIPKRDWNRMFELTNMLLGAQDPEFQGSRTALDTAREASKEQTLYFLELIEERRRNPGPDLISGLIAGEINGNRLSNADLAADCSLLMAGGQETTRNATSAGFAAILERPEERARLLADPSLIPLFVEESLRWASPITHLRRTLTRNYDFHGFQMKEGQFVVCWLASANRDEDVFPDPYRFDVGRTPNEHISFNYGEHFCLGANIARLEMKVMFEELLKRMPDAELAGPVERLRSNFVSGIKHMPIRFTPSRPSKE